VRILETRPSNLFMDREVFVVRTSKSPYSDFLPAPRGGLRWELERSAAIERSEAVERLERFERLLQKLERLIPLDGRAVKQANVVYRITAAGLVIDATIVPHHEIAQGPFVTIHVLRRRLVSE